jgi:hypothetical protein
LRVLELNHRQIWVCKQAGKEMDIKITAYEMLENLNRYTKSSFNPLTPNDIYSHRAVIPLKIKFPNKNMREKPTNTPIINLFFLIMYSSFYMFRHYITILRERS